MKKIFLISFIILLNNILFAQNPADSINPKTKKIRKNAVFVELAGHSMLGPNYERKLFTNNHFSIYSSIGISYFNYYDKGPKFPFRLSVCLYNFEAGLGTESILYNDWWFKERAEYFDPEIVYYIFSQPFIGYRTKRNLLFKASFTPWWYYGVIDDMLFFPWAGISLGYCF